MVYEYKKCRSLTTIRKLLHLMQLSGGGSDDYPANRPMMVLMMMMIPCAALPSNVRYSYAAPFFFVLFVSSSPRSARAASATNAYQTMVRARMFVSCIMSEQQQHTQTFLFGKLFLIEQFISSFYIFLFIFFFVSLLHTGIRSMYYTYEYVYTMQLSFSLRWRSASHFTMHSVFSLLCDMFHCEWIVDAFSYSIEIN